MDNVMIDIESLGTRPGSVILSIGAVRFDPSARKGQLFIDPKKFYRAIDVFDSLLSGLTVDPDTCRWWAGQDPVAIGAVRASTHHLLPTLRALIGFLRHTDYVWAKGPDFDLVMLTAAFEKVGLKVPWKFRNARDVRTILHLGQMAQVPNMKRGGVKHCALDDAVYQAQQVQQVYSYLDFDTTIPCDLTAKI